MRRPARIAFLTLVVVQDPHELTLEAPHRGEIRDSDAVLTSPAIQAARMPHPVRGVEIEFVAPRPSNYAFELRSPWFDAVLIVRDAQGKVLAEDDDGLALTDARVVVPLRAEQIVRLSVGALHGERGSFELTAQESAPGAITAQDRRALELEGLRRRLEVREERFGAESEGLIPALDRLGNALWQRERYREALVVLERALELCRRHFGDRAARTGMAHAQVGAQWLGLREFERAEAEYRRALAIVSESRDARPEWIELILQSRAQLCLDAGRPRAATIPQAELVLRLEARLGPLELQTIVAREWLVSTALQAGCASEHLDHARELLAALRELRGPTAEETIAAHLRLIRALSQAGAHEEALVSSREIAALGQTRSDPTIQVRGLQSEAHALLSAKLHAEAETVLRRALPLAEMHAKAIVLELEISLTAALVEQDKHQEAEPLARRCLDTAVRMKSAPEAILEASRRNLLYVLHGLRKSAEALPLQRAEVEALRRSAPGSGILAIELHNLAELEHSQGWLERAAPLYQESLALTELREGYLSESWGETLQEYASLLLRLERPDEVLRLAQPALSGLLAALGASHPVCLRLAADLALAASRIGGPAPRIAPLDLLLWLANERGESKDIAYVEDAYVVQLLEADRFEQALAWIVPRVPAPGVSTAQAHEEIGWTALHVAEALMGLGRLEEAEGQARRALASYEASGRHDLVIAAAVGLGAVLQERSRTGEAEEVLRRALRLCGESALDREGLRDRLDSTFACVLMDRGLFTEAESILRSVTERTRARWTSAQPTARIPVLNHIACLRHLDRLDEAERRARELAEIYELRTQDPGNLADLYVRWGEIHEARGDGARAEALFRKALALRYEATSASELELAADRNRLGSAIAARTEEAEGLLRSAVETAERLLGSASDKCIRYHLDLVRFLNAERRFAEAIEIATQAAGDCERVHPPGHVRRALCALALARALVGAGRNAEAEEMLASAREPIANGFETQPWHWADAALELCSVALLLDVPVLAERTSTAMIAHIESSGSGNVHRLSVLWVYRGNALATQGRLREARTCLRRALSMSETRGVAGIETSIAALGTLASLEFRRGRVADAIELSKRRLEHCERSGAGSFEAWDARADLAAYLLHAGEIDEGADLARGMADPSVTAVVGPRNRVTACAVLGWIAWSQGRPEEAERWLREGFASTADPASRSLASAMAENLGLLLHAEGHDREGLELLHHARSYHASELERALHSFSSSDRMHAVADFSQITRRILLLSDLSDSFQGRIGLEFATSVQGLLSRMSRVELTSWSSAAEARTRAAWSELRALSSKLSDAAFSRGVIDVATHAGQLRQLAWSKRLVEQELLGSDPGRVALEVLDVDELSARLPSRSACLCFAVLPSLELWKPGRAKVELQPGRVLAFVLRSGSSEVQRFDLGGAHALGEAQNSFLREVEAHGGSSPLRRSRNETLRRALWDPVAPALVDTDLVFVVPDDFLARLPVHGLKDAQGRYLLEERTFVYASDALSLLEMLRRDEPPRMDAPRLLAAGSVDYGPASESPPFVGAESRGGFRWEWPALPGTGPECDAISAAHRRTGGEAVLLVGSHATEERVKVEAERSQVVHLSTHGFFEPAGVPSLLEALRLRESEAGSAIPLSPAARVHVTGHPPELLSGLVLAGANAHTRGREAGYLTADEIRYLDLRRCELVVLSGCETGLGATRGGEGLLGLRRALHTAGARTVIASHWRVPDQGTRQLMEEFYRQLWEPRLPPAAALRAAQLRVLARQRELGVDEPGAWAAFALSGDWR